MKSIDKKLKGAHLSTIQTMGSYTHIANTLNLKCSTGLYLVASEPSLLAWKRFCPKETTFLILDGNSYLQRQMFTEL